MWRGNYRRKTITPGHQHNASMSLTFPIRTYVHSLTGGCASVYRDICPTSQIRTEVRMKKFWARHREARQFIDLDGLFSDYWSSSNNEFIVLSQSLSQPARADLIEKNRGRCRWKI